MVKTSKHQSSSLWSLTSGFMPGRWYRSTRHLHPDSPWHGHLLSQPCLPSVPGAQLSSRDLASPSALQLTGSWVGSALPVSHFFCGAVKLVWLDLLLATGVLSSPGSYPGASLVLDFFASGAGAELAFSLTPNIGQD